MKKSVLLSLFFLLISLCYAQSKIIESQTMPSTLLANSIKYSVYLPDGFESSDEKYPIVYLLNGFTGDETNWARKGLLKDITDELIRANKIKPMVIIMPDGDDRLYMNKDDGTYPYEDMFITEFMPFVEKEYRIKSEKQFRGISGLSMGGAGTLRLALKYNTLFKACAAFSSALFSLDEIINMPQRNYDGYFGKISPSAIGSKDDARITETIKDYLMLNLMATKSIDELKSINIYFDCGDDDFLTVGNSLLRLELLKKGVPHEYRVRDGAHTWNFWVDSLPVGLEFISRSMDN